MASDTDVKVWVVTDRVLKPNVISCSCDFTAEDLCILLCKKYKISPLTRTLFALKVVGTDYFLNDNRKISTLESKELELRIRFKVPRIQQLMELDAATYDYYFRQVRDDVRENRIPDIKYPEHKHDVLGLGITDMYRATIEDNIPEYTVVKNYKNYIPKVILKNHGYVAKNRAQKSLPRLANRETNTVTFVKALYLQKLHSMAPQYLSEEYRDVTWRNDVRDSKQVHLHIVPFHTEEPGLRMYDTLLDEWTQVSTIENLVCMTRGVGNVLEISRKEGPPLIFQFKTEAQLSSFLSVCDGYYRLMVKWTYNLSNDDKTPSLVYLYRLRCHGPVGGAFSYQKLKEKGSNINAAYILRQCKDEYDVYYLDVLKNGNVDTFRVEFKDNRYVFNDKEYASILELRADYEKPAGEIYLGYCVPPSEYDQSQLLLCGEKQKKGVLIQQDQLPEILKDNKSPRCIRNCEILYEDKRPVGTRRADASSITVTCKGLWKIDDTNKLDIAYKKVKDDKVKDELKGFIDLASKWTSLQESTIVKLYGITLSSPTAMVLEWIPYGPLDEYLRTKRNRIKPHHLKTVAAGLARALWHLSESGVVHGHIRARRLLVAMQDDNRIVVKLSCPSLRAYRKDDEPWIPIEFRTNMSLAKLSEEGDIWAFATTLWEVFTYGKSPCAAKYVVLEDGNTRLPAPPRCPAAVWRQMLACWRDDPHARTRPQEIMRNMIQMLHVNDDDVSESELSYSDNPCYSISETGSLIPRSETSNSDGNNSSARTISTMLSSQKSSKWSVWQDRVCMSQDEPTKLHSFISHQQEQSFHFVKIIGSGNYGKVWIAMLERENRRIAVKRFKPETSRDDCMNELEIMKTLYHPHIVKIEGLWDDSPEVGIVMEYLELGSLDNFLKTENDINTCLLLKYGRDIASAMDYISAKDIVHRDLAARNILVADRRTVKISDFGLSRLLPKTEDMYKVRSDHLLPVPWYAPEASVFPYSFTTKGDVWSYGVTLWEMFQIRAKFGQKIAFSVPQFSGNPENRAEVFVKPRNCSTRVYEDLMKICWEFDPQKRPKFIELVQVCISLLIMYKNPDDKTIDDIY